SLRLFFWRAWSRVPSWAAEEGRRAPRTDHRPGSACSSRHPFPFRPRFGRGGDAEKIVDDRLDVVARGEAQRAPRLAPVGDTQVAQEIEEVGRRVEDLRRPQ